MLQELGLTEGFDYDELSTEPKFDDSCLEYWMCIARGDLIRRLELCDEALVVSVLTLFVVIRLT